MARDLVEEIFARARAMGVPQARLADKAGLRAETLSRLKRRANFDVETLRCLALAVGCRLALAPLEQGAEVYSPRDNARAKARSRERDEALVAEGIVTRGRLQQRRGFFSAPRARFAIKGLGPAKR